jgi:hypothetical protein
MASTTGTKRDRFFGGALSLFDTFKDAQNVQQQKARFCLGFQLTKRIVGMARGGFANDRAQPIDKRDDSGG